MAGRPRILEGHAPAEPVVEGAVHAPHPPFSQELLDDVSIERRPRLEQHGRHPTTTRRRARACMLPRDGPAPDAPGLLQPLCRPLGRRRHPAARPQRGEPPRPQPPHPGPGVRLRRDGPRGPRLARGAGRHPGGRRRLPGAPGSLLPAARRRGAGPLPGAPLRPLPLPPRRPRRDPRPLPRLRHLLPGRRRRPLRTLRRARRLRPRGARLAVQPFPATTPRWSTRTPSPSWSRQRSRRRSCRRGRARPCRSTTASCSSTTGPGARSPPRWRGSSILVFRFTVGLAIRPGAERERDVLHLREHRD